MSWWTDRSMLPPLPAELWFQIANHLTTHDLNLLSRSNRALYSFILPILYRDITFRGHEVSDAKTCRTLIRMSINLDLSRAIRSCTLRSMGSKALDYAISSFKCFPNLSKVTLDGFVMDEYQLDQLLINIDKHPFSLKLTLGAFAAADPRRRGVIKPLIYQLNGPLPRLTTLSITNISNLLVTMPPFAYWMTTPTLEHLYLDDNSFLLGCSTGPLSAPFPKLKTLHIAEAHNVDMKLFGLMPLLEVLSFIYSDATALPKQSLPRLCHYAGAIESLAQFVPGRPIHTVELWPSHEPFCYSSLGTPTPNFGSLTTIRSLVIRGAKCQLEALIFSVAACPTLHTLEIKQAWSIRTTPAVFVSDHMQHLRRLTVLRQLVYRQVSGRTSRNKSHNSILAWERRVCEVLERTAPDIRSVMITTEEWRKSDIDGSWYRPRPRMGVDVEVTIPAFVAGNCLPDPAEASL